MSVQLVFWVLAPTAQAAEPLMTLVWQEQSDVMDAKLGGSVANAGDVNGDGFDDIIAGAPYDLVGLPGQTFVYLGSASGPESEPSWVVTASEASPESGWAASGAGDVNGDGFDEVIVGSEVAGPGGEAYLYLGSALGLDTSPAWIGVGHDALALYGSAVAGAGDVNGDGFDDVIVGASNVHLEGRAFVYHGSPAGLATTPATVLGVGVHKIDNFGEVVAPAGDVDGDGFDDVIVGDDLHNQEGGAAFVYHGSPLGLEQTPAWSKAGAKAGAGQFGRGIASAGDVNADGFDDIVVSDPFDRGGQAYLFLGSSDGLELRHSWTAVPHNGGANFGFSVSSLGDVNGDGLDDVAIGAPFDGNRSAEMGKAWVYFGSASTGLVKDPVWAATSRDDNSEFGWSVAGADVDGDGLGDLIVGAPLIADPEVREGALFAYLGQCIDLTADSDCDGVGDRCDDDPGPVCDLQLTGADPGIAGQKNAWELTGAPPGVSVKFLWGVDLDAFEVSTCGARASLDIDDPQFLGRAVTDAQGRARIVEGIPLSLQGTNMVVQALLPDTCNVSPVAATTIP